MRKRVFAKRVLTVVLAVTMMLSNNVAALASALPDVSGEQTEIITEMPKTDEETETAVNDSAAISAAEAGKDDSTLPLDIMSLTVVAEEQSVDTSLSSLPDNDTLLEGFLERELKEQINIMNPDSSNNNNGRRALMRAVPRSQAMNLSGNDLALYNFLKIQIRKIADGELDSSVINVPLSTLNGGKLHYTQSDIGSVELWSQESANLISSYYHFNLSPVVNALLADCPYDFYWYDKTPKGGCWVDGQSYGFDFTGTNQYMDVADVDIPIHFAVSADYSPNGAIKGTTVDTTKTHAASNAATVAASVVSQYSSLSSDYAKLEKYRDWICEAVEYDHTVNPTDHYGDPWQVIRVFDENSSTNVVCEGYSKAFKWLCDLTDFADSNVGCYVVGGMLGQNGYSLGGHMWNIVRMDDEQYYLADITNYDEDEYGYLTPELFLQGYDDYTEEDGYIINTHYHGTNYVSGYLTFKYLPETIAQFSENELAISKSGYIDLVKVTFNANGHGVAPTPIVNIPRGSKITAPTAPVAAGYIFGGWYRDPECNTEWDFSTDTIDLNTELYAKWTENRRRVTFYRNYNSSDSTVFSQFVLDSISTSLNGNPFSREGYTFNGWNTEPNGTGASYGNEESIRATSDISLYAQWKVVNADAPIITNEPAEITDIVFGGSEITLTVEARAAQVSGYTLSYQWYKNSDKVYDETKAIEGETSNTITITPSKVGSEFYYCAVTATKNSNSTTATLNSIIATVNVAKATPVVSAPIAKTTLVYSGTNQELVSAGTVSGGCSMQYSLSPIGPFSTSIPVGMNAKSYNVYYKTVGNENYEDTEVAGPISVSISKKQIMVTGGITAEKIYDKTAFVVLDCSSATFDGLLPGDRVSTSGTGEFTDVNAGQHTVNIKSIAISDSSVNSNYVVIDNPNYTSFEGTITKRLVTVSAILAEDKEYDANLDATLYYGQIIYGNKIEDDSISVTATGTFDTKNVGTGKLVTIGGYTLSGLDSGNYNIDTTNSQSTTTASINPRIVRIKAETSGSKTYDGKTSIPVLRYETDDLIEGDDISVKEGVANFVDADCGVQKTIIFSGFGLEGNDAFNYELTSQPQNELGDINKAFNSVAVRVLDDIRIYNGEYQIPSVVVEYRVPNTNDILVLNNSDYSLTYENNKDVGEARVTAHISGDNYVNMEVTGQFEIRKADLTVTALNQTIRVGGTYQPNLVRIDGLKGNDSESLIHYYTSVPDNYSSAATTDYSLVTITVNVTNESELRNYNVIKVDGYITVNAKDQVALSVSQENITFGDTLPNPHYDTVEGIIVGPSVRYAGTEANGNQYSGAMKPTNAGNYQVYVSYETAVSCYTGFAEFSIAKKSISGATVKLGSPLTYNGNWQIQELASVIIDQKDILSGCGIIGNEAIKAGDYTFTVVAPTRSNYTGSVSKSFSVAPKVVTVTEGITALNKDYDGSATAILNTDSVVLDGIVNEDTLSVSATGYFDNCNSGKDKTVTIENIVFSGDSSSNYQLAETGNQETTMASILPLDRPVVATVSGSFVYDGTAQEPAITVMYADSNQSVSTDDYDVNYSTNKEAGTAYYKVYPKDGSNYTFSSVIGTFEIAKRPITVRGITAENKAYNAANGASLNYNNVILSGKVDGDNLSVTATGSFENVNAGTNKKVIISNLTLGGLDAANYELASSGQQLETIATIAPRDIAPSITVTGGYTYNGEAITPIFEVRDVDLGRKLDPSDYDSIIANNVNAGTATITIIGKGNYSFAAIKTFTINKASVTVKANDVSKMIGNDDPSEFFATVTGLIGNDTIDYTVTRTELGDALGEYEITAAGSTIQGNYLVSYIPGKLTIIPKAVGSISVTQTNATYGTLLDNPSFDHPSGQLVRQVILYSGTLSDGSIYDSSAEKPTEIGNYTVYVKYETSDTVYEGTTSFEISKVSIADATVTLGTSLTYNGSEQTQAVAKVELGSADITSYCQVSDNAQTNAGTYTLIVTAASNSNYTGSVTKQFEISKKSVTIDNLATQNKVYDGTSNALIEVSGTANLQGVVDTDAAYVEAELTGLYGRSTVGDGGDIAISITGASLKGDRAGNYELTSYPNSTSGKITRKAITITGITAENKVYDGSATATLKLGNATVSGVIDADKSKVSVTANGSFADKNVGTGKTVTIAEPTLTGDAAGNYVVSDYTSTATANITAKNVTITGTTAEEKVYDGTTAATIDYAGYLDGAVNGDDVSIFEGRAEFANKNAGENKSVIFTGFTLTGADAGNYTLTDQPVALRTGKITKKELVISGIVANAKTYDGTKAVTFDTTHATLAGLISGENVGIEVTGSFSDVNAGNNNNVTITSIALTGADAGNYTINTTTSQTTATAAINKATKANVTATPTDVRAGGTDSGKIDLREYLKDDASKTNSNALMSAISLVSYSFTDDLNTNPIISDIAMDSEGYLSYKATPSVSGYSGNMILTVSSDNYADYTITVPMTIAAKAAETELDNSDASAAATTGIGQIQEIGDLKTFANEQSGDSVDVKLSVKPESEATLTGGSEEEKAAVEEIKEVAREEYKGIAESDIKQDFVEIDITKSVDGGTPEKVTDTGRVLDIIFKYNTIGRHNLSVSRFHDNKASRFKKLTTKPTDYRELDGCFYIEGTGKDAVIHIYSRRYSVYSISYTEKEMFEVKYDNAAGTVASTNVLSGNKLTKPADPTRDGYTFAGWFDQTGKAFDFNSAVTSAIVLTAKWTAKAKPAESSNTTTDNNSSANESQSESNGSASTENTTAAPASKSVAKATTTTPAKTEKKEAKADVEGVTPTKVEEPTEEAVVIDDVTPIEPEETKEETKPEPVKEDTQPTEPVETKTKKPFSPWALAGILGGAAVLAAGAWLVIKKKPL